MPDLDPVLSFTGLRFGYSPGQAVIEGCNATLEPGKVSALVGPNAAGKSTLLRLMLGLHQPWAGRVLLAGQPIDQVHTQQRARLVSYVPQRPGVRFAFTVREVVAMGAFAQGQATQGEIDEALEQAGLSELRSRVFAELSGGQQQRALLARAELQVARGGRAMLLDEPGSHLDLSHRHAMMRRLRELAAGGLAVLIVLHDLDLAVRYADDAWLMDQGELVAAGAWGEVLTPKRLAPVYGVDLQWVETGGDRPLLAVASGSDATIVR